MTKSNLETDRYAIVSFGKKKENFIGALEHNVIGSKHTTFEKHIKLGQIVFFHCNGFIWGYGKVNSNYFFDKTTIWEDNIYPHRFGVAKIAFNKYGISTSSSSFTAKMREQFGYGWGFSFIFAPKALPHDLGKLLKDQIDLNPTTDTSFIKDI